MRRFCLVILLLAASLQAFAQTTTTPVSPGHLRTANCPGGASVCFSPDVAASGAFSGATVATTHAQVLAAGTAQSYLMLANPSAAGGNSIYCSFGGTAVVAAAGTIAIAPGQSYTWESSYIPNDAIDCIAATGSTPLTIGVK
jgi:hypothetical protein